MAIVKCKTCGSAAVRYPSGVVCVPCRRQKKLDLQVQATIPKGKIKTKPLTLENTEKMPLFSRKLADKQTSLF